MRCFDVFNGDADGMCALHQWRLAFPCDSTLFTGIKRDIALLDRVPALAGDSVTVFDLCANPNRAAIESMLHAGVYIHYIDHHVCAPLPAHPQLRALIDPDPQVCTAILVDRLLAGRYRGWAVVGAYGDNLSCSAQRLARSLRLGSEDRRALRRLGICLNYNAYGESIDDLVIHPAALYRSLQPYHDPRAALRAEPMLASIANAMQADLSLASSVTPIVRGAGGTVTLLPDAPWSRRVSGTLANALARSERHLAHAVLTPRRDGSLSISVRSPQTTLRGADTLCAQFAQGGGRPAAAGILALPADAMDEFLRQFALTFPEPAMPKPLSNEPPTPVGSST
jgi:hypothetical protein